MKDPLKALFGKPDYSRIVRDTTATISITAAEMAAVLEGARQDRHTGRHPTQSSRRAFGKAVVQRSS